MEATHLVFTCFPYVFPLFSFIFFCFLWVLEVVTSVATSPYLFYFIFVPRVTSNRKVVWFGELAVFCPDFCASPKTSVLSARTWGIFYIYWAPAPGFYLTFISFALFDLSNKRFSKKIIFTCCSVLTDFCQYLHLPLNLFLLCSFGGKSLKISCDSS